MPYQWRDYYNKYIQLQRNHKTYNAEMLEELILKQQREINLINSILDRVPNSVLDIGCGLGIYDLAINDFYSTNNIKFHLLDKTTSEEEEKNVYYGHQEIGAYYNNLDYTKEFLMINGVSEENINCITVSENLTDVNENLKNNLTNIDLIISIISWGFHYPVKTYLDSIYQILANDGLLCFHCRSLSENLPVLEEKFEIISPSNDDIKEGSFLICRKKIDLPLNESPLE